MNTSVMAQLSYSCYIALGLLDKPVWVVEWSASILQWVKCDYLKFMYNTPLLHRTGPVIQQLQTCLHLPLPVLLRTQRCSYRPDDAQCVAGPQLALISGEISQKTWLTFLSHLSNTGIYVSLLLA